MGILYDKSKALTNFSKMNPFWALVLGTIQGLSEFLPISSSGHLVLLQKLIPRFSQPGVLFDAVVHLGTVFAVLFFFRKNIFSLSKKYMVFIVLGTLPAALAGFLFREEFELMFSSAKFLGYEFILTGIFDLAVDLPVKRTSSLNNLNSLLIGVAQAVSIIPGISRSGATIFTGVRLGVDKSEVGRYSFLLSVPAILGANILEISAHGLDSLQGSFQFYLIGFLASFLVGIISIGIVLKFLLNNKFKFFGFYTLALGLLVILFI